MTTDSSELLDGITPESIARGDVDDAAIHTALSSSNPLVRQRGVAVCETLVAENLDATRPFLDEVAMLAGDDNAAIALRAISVLDTLADTDPAALEGRLADLVGAVGTDHVDVQLTGATALGKLVVDRPDLVAPYARQLIEAVRVTELDATTRDFSDVVDDDVTRRTLRDHEEEERKRRTTGRRTLINVVIAIIEAEPKSTVDLAEDLGTLLDDADPVIVGGAVDALGELAAANPEAVFPVRNRLDDCLDHDSVAVRVRAIRALGHIGDDAAVPKLRAVAMEDIDETVREIALETADFLADAS